MNRQRQREARRARRLLIIELGAVCLVSLIIGAAVYN